MPEHFKALDQDYEVGDRGTVRRLRDTTNAHAGLILSPHLTNGHWCLKIHGRMKVVARLVAQVFLGDPPVPTCVVRYRDGNPKHITLNNIFWALRPRVVKGKPTEFKEVSNA